MRNAIHHMSHANIAVKERLEIRQLHPGEERVWDEFVTSSPSGTFFHLTGWANVVETVLRHRCFKLAAVRGNTITGVFPISWIRNKIFGDCLVSLPLAVYGGICAEEEESYSGLLKAGSDLATRLGVKYLEMRNRTEPFATSLPGRDLYVTFTQDLSPGPEKLLQALPRDTRYIVRKSLKGGLTFTEDITLNEFYDLYAGSVHRLGTPVFSRGLFEALRHYFPDNCRLFGVRKGKQAIASVFCFYFKDRVMPYYGGSLAEFNRDSPNNFMYWSLMMQSHAEGIGHFDFGRSKRGTGSFNFKSTWSMKMDTLPYRYQLVRARAVPHLSPVDSKFQLPIAVWKRIPFSWTKVLGPRVIPWIPSV
jgi:FemAB-related protein (PEP-CTERM system-associated)